MNRFFPQLLLKTRKHLVLKMRVIFFVPIFLLISVGVFAGKPDNKLIVYYFHRTARCPSCILLENITRDTVISGFDAEIKSGKIEIKVVNIDIPQNAHFEKDYSLQFQSVVLSKIVNGAETKWKNLTRVWDYLHEDDKFTDYVQQEVRNFLTKPAEGLDESEKNPN